MKIEDLEFYGAKLTVEFAHIPDDLEVGFHGYCELTSIYMGDERWWSPEDPGNFLTGGAAHEIRGCVESHIKALERASNWERARNKI